jgi:hypothetical protein
MGKLLSVIIRCNIQEKTLVQKNQFRIFPRIIIKRSFFAAWSYEPFKIFT